MPRPLRYLARSLTFGAVTTAALLSLGAAKKKNGAKCFYLFFSWGPRFPKKKQVFIFFWQVVRLKRNFDLFFARNLEINHSYHYFLGAMCLTFGK